MIDVNFYKFTKRTSSTKQPETPAVTLQCSLKAPTSIISPMLKINTPNITEYNYCYIPMWGRYYWIADLIYNNGLWSVSLSLDPLASWKSYIGESTQYVLRSSNTYDGSISDDTYPGTSVMSSKVFETSESFWGFDDGLVITEPTGCFVVGVVGSSTTDYYLMGPPGMQKFVDYLYSDDYIKLVIPNYNPDDAPELKVQLNPVNYIKSIVYYPFVPTPLVSEPATYIRIGWGAVPNNDTTGFNALKIKNYTLYKHSVNITRAQISTLSHPQSARGSYLNTSPYTEYFLYWPGFGKIALDADVIANCSKLTLEALVDLKSGECLGRIYATVSGTEYLASRLTTSIGMNIQVSQVLSTGYGNLAGIVDKSAERGIQLGIMSSLIGAGSSGVTQHDNLKDAGVGITGFDVRGVAGGIMDAGGGYYQAKSLMANIAANKLKGRTPSLTTIGTNSGSLAGAGGPVILTADHQHIVPEDNEDLGRPLFQMQKLSDIPGYMVILHPDFYAPATAQEINAVKNYMSSGFFYE